MTYNTTPRIIAVTGGRDYADAGHVWATLDALHAAEPISQLLHGGARGLDTIASGWASKRDVPRTAYPADWDLHGKNAGPIRNARMLCDGKPTLLVAFSGGRGTRNCIRQARLFGIAVLEACK